MSDGGDHPVLAVLGLLAVATGVLFVARPDLAAAIGTSYSVVTIIGLLALVQFFRVARARRHSEVAGAETPDVETVADVPTPGDGFDRRVGSVDTKPPRARISARNDVRETLRAAARRTLVDREGHSPARAEDHLDAGTWTDDDTAAAFLALGGAPPPSVGERLRAAAGRRTPTEVRVARTVEAITALGEGPDGATTRARDGGADATSAEGRHGRTSGWREAATPGGDR